MTAHPTAPIEFRIPPRAEVLGPIRVFVRDLSRQLGFTEDQADLIVLAVDEALANAIRHGGSAEDSLVVRVRSDQRRIEVVVEDRGREFAQTFDQPFALEDHLQEMKTHGLGLHIMKTVMDSVVYQRTSDHRNVVTLVKHLPVASAASQ
ncbi:MAG: ATP-binding protein [Candidatus Omnitrophica bacterium]|nr:Serine-protein kinase RsbW [bacterium]NUN98537.1 ATP-binding protein [Candidatus Omnitrophota bacterium]